MGKLVCYSLIILLISININAVTNFEFKEKYHYSPLLTDYRMFNPPNNLTDYSIREVDQFDTGFGYMLDLQVIDNLALTNVHRGGLLVFNVSDLTNPHLIGSYDEPREITEDNLWGNYGGIGNGLTIKNNLVYLCGGLTGMLIINITDPTNPQKIGHYRDSAINNVIVHQNYAYCLSYPGLTIINITHPSNPIFIKSITDQEFSTGLIYEYVIHNNYLLTLGSDLVIFDISDPSNLFEVARLNVNLGKMVIDEDRLFIVTSPTISNFYTSKLSIINISNPYNPALIYDQEITEIDAFVNDIQIYNSTIFVSSEKKLFAFNLSYAYNVTYQNSLFVAGSLGEIEVHRVPHLNGSNYDLVFCANSRGLQVVDFTTTTNPFLVSVTSLGSRTMKVFVDENYVYLCTQYEFPSRPSTLLVLKHLNGEIQQVISSFTFTDEVITDVFVYNHFAFIAGYYNGLIILNLTNPLNPEIICTFSDGISTSKAIYYDFKSDLVFLANYEYGYSIIDVSNKTNPSLLYGGNYWGMSVTDLFYENELLFLADDHLYGGFGIVNVSNPTNPIHIQAINLEESVFSIYAKENLLYLSTDLTPLMIFDIQHPTEPVFLGELYTGKWFDGYGLSVKENLAYIAREANGLMVIDVYNPKKPRLLVEYRDYYAGLSYDVIAFGEYIFLADGWDGLEIYQLILPIISQRVLLIISILPSMIGFGIVAFIAVLIIRKQKLSLVSL